MSVVNEIPDYLSLAALSGTVLLTPLYLSQRRDVARLRELRERDPEHARRDLADSEAVLDRAERDIEEVLIATGQFAAVTPQTEAGQATPIPPGQRVEAGATPIPPGARVTSERPALERITMERQALAPHPRWRRFAKLAMAPRTLAVVGLLAVAIGIAALVAFGQILGGGNEGSGGSVSASGSGRASVSVAVLNGSSDATLGHSLGREVKRRGFDLGPVADSGKQFQQTVVMFSPGDKREATKVAHVLSVTPIQPIDSQTRAEAPDADVVVIAGADRVENQP